MDGFKRHDEKQVDPEKIWNDDAFQTLEKYANFLSNALTANTRNFVLNVNGSWGTGKSFFVQRWAEDLRQKKHPVVEFNAWENDSAEDPLAPLIASVLEQQKDLLPAPLRQKIKDNCGKFLMAGGGLIVRAGLKHLVGEKGVDEVNDLLSSGAENELIKLAGNYVDEQLVKQKASKGLTEVLGEFVAGIQCGETHKLPLFIFIDELDRCRPTFAIELLERVKHLFHVDGIKFIISTDTEQLVHSIRAVYGHEFDADVYLHRFFDQTFKLPSHSPMEYADMLFDGYFKTEDEWKNSWVVERTPEYTFGYLCKQYGLNLRTQQQIFRRLMTVIPNIKLHRSDERLHFILLCLLAIMRVEDKTEYKDFVHDGDNITIRGRSSMWQETLYATLLKSTHLEIEQMRSNYTETMGQISEEQRIENEKLDIIEDWYRNYDYLSAYPEIMELTEAMF